MNGINTSPIERTLSSDSGDSSAYLSYSAPPPWFNPVIARPDVSSYHPPPIAHPALNSQMHHHHQQMHPHHAPPMQLVSPPLGLGQIQQQMYQNGTMSLLPGQEDVTDEVIPTAVVIKNIPFSVPRDHVVAIMVCLLSPSVHKTKFKYCVMI